MSIIMGLLEILVALALIFAIAFAVYGIISTMFKYKGEKEMEELMNRNSYFYDDDEYEDMY